jgi:hypothetical protein
MGLQAKPATTMATVCSANRRDFVVELQSVVERMATSMMENGELNPCAQSEKIGCLQTRSAAYKVGRENGFTGKAHSRQA